MSFERPITKRNTTSMNPITPACSITRNGTGRPADLLDQAPEDVAAVERQEREQVDDRQREADHGRAAASARRMSSAKLCRVTS